MEKSWKSFDAGLIDVIIGLILTGVGIILPFAILNFKSLSSFGTIGSTFIAISITIVLLFLGLFIVYGGEMAMKKRRWGVALAASICASLVIFGLPSLLLIIISRKEFESKKPING
jgi:hypothetical protein